MAKNKSDNSLPSIFEGFELRKSLHNDEWFFSVVDIIKILTGSPTPRQYWSKLKEREFILMELSPIWVRLKLLASDGKLRETDCVNFQNSLRLIQSIPSKKAEPFKLWLASLGQAEVYRQQGYDEYWIEQRMKSKLARYEITDEWKNRGVELQHEFAKLTNVIAKETFGKNIQEHKKLKNLKNAENLRDNTLEFLQNSVHKRLIVF